MNNTTKNILKWGLTILIIVVSIYFSIRDVNLEKLIFSLKNANLLWAFLTIPVQLLSHYVRAIRWGTFLKPIKKPESTLNLLSAVMVGYFFNNILPRGGEFIRPYVYSKREKTPYSSVFATIVIERIIDLLTLVLLFAVAFFITKDKIINAFPNDIEPNKLIYMTLLLIGVLFLGFYQPFIHFIFDKLIKPISKPLHEKLTHLYDKFRKGFEIIKTPSAYFRIILESLLIWFCYALPMYMTFYCFDFSASLNFGLGDALLLVIISGIGVTIAPTPNGLGVYHYVVTVAVMSLYGLDKTHAFAYATLNHAINTVVQLVFGGIFFFRERLQEIPSSEELSHELETENL